MYWFDEIAINRKFICEFLMVDGKIVAQYEINLLLMLNCQQGIDLIFYASNT